MKIWVELVEKYRRTFMGKLVQVIRPFAFSNGCFWNLGCSPPRETGEAGAPSFLMIPLQYT